MAGIEAMSRGASSATFVESDQWCVQNCLKPNLRSTGLLQSSSVLSSDALAFLGPQRQGGRGKAFDFVSCCPPYEHVDYEHLISSLSTSDCIADGALIVVEYPFELRHLLPASYGRLSRVRDRRYGRTFLAVYLASSD